MSLIRWSGSLDPFQEMDDAMKQFSPPALSPLAKAFIPAIDMYETADAVVVETPLAGIDPEDVAVSVEKGVLTLHGTSRNEHEVEEKNYYRKEVRSGTFYRQIPLPVPVKDDGVTAEFVNGILRVTAPKVVPTEGRRINVTVVKKNDEKK